jgi:hypothetical protein
LAAHTGRFLIGLQHRADLIVIHNYRPEILHRDIWGEAQPVSFCRRRRAAIG